MSEVALMPTSNTTQVHISHNDRGTARLLLKMKVDGEACAEQTRIAETQDRKRFIDYHNTVVGIEQGALDDEHQ